MTRAGRPQEQTEQTRRHHMVRLSNAPENAPVFEGTGVPVQHLFDYMEVIAYENVRSAPKA